MRSMVAVLIWISLVLLPASIDAHQRGDDNPSFSSSMGLSISAPLNPLGHYVSSGLGIDYSAGYNFTRRHPLAGEFIWNWLFPTNESLQPLRVAFTSRNIDAHGNLFAATAN
jgi:hypothetical protein